MPGDGDAHLPACGHGCAAVGVEIDRRWWGVGRYHRARRGPQLSRLRGHRIGRANRALERLQGGAAFVGIATAGVASRGRARMDQDLARALVGQHCGAHSRFEHSPAQIDPGVGGHGEGDARVTPGEHVVARSQELRLIGGRTRGGVATVPWDTMDRNGTTDRGLPLQRGGAGLKVGLGHPARAVPRVRGDPGLDDVPLVLVLLHPADYESVALLLPGRPRAEHHFYRIDARRWGCRPR